MSDPWNLKQVILPEGSNEALSHPIARCIPIRALHGLPDRQAVFFVRLASMEG